MYSNRKKEGGGISAPLLPSRQQGAGSSQGPQAAPNMNRRTSVTSPAPDRRQSSSGRQRLSAIHPALQPARQRDKFVALPEEESDDGVPLPPAELPVATGEGGSLNGTPMLGTARSAGEADLLPPPGPAGPGLFEDLPAPAQLTMPRHSSAALPGASAQLALPPPPPHAVYGSSAHALGPGAGTFLSPGPPVGLDAAGWRGRITFYCIAESFDRKKAEELLRRTYPPGAVRSFPDAFHVEYIKGADGAPGGDFFLFDYGVVACWGMAKTQEMTIVRGIASQCCEHPLPEQWIEIDEFQYCYSHEKQQHVQNDTVTLHKRYAQDHKMKLAISYALAQSTKLLVHEKRVTDIVLETRNLPESLAEHGEVTVSAHDIARLIGKVFLEKSAVNLLGSVLGTPEFFWHAPDSFQALYTRVTEYLELDSRLELLNSRFAVLQEMLDMLRDHQNNHHNVRLEWIVIWLIAVEAVVGMFQLLGLFGIVGLPGKS